MAPKADDNDDEPPESTTGRESTSPNSSSGNDNSSINNKWLFSPGQLEECRSRANHGGRTYLKKLAAARQGGATNGGAGEDNGKNNNGEAATPPPPPPPPPVRWFASGYAERVESGNREEEEEEEEEEKEEADGGSSANGNDADGDGSSLPHPPLTPEEELLLVQFYSGKIPDLIGPSAMLGRLRRDVKVTATASALFRRFFLSNSVMVHDPKAIMVASAFLGSKVEDATVAVQYLEEATKQMQAPVTQKEIIAAEISLVAGVHFELLCLHPYKTVLAYTEDLRTYLKTGWGRKLATFPGNEDRPVVGEDLRPMHDEARRIVDDACVSDVTLLASPGQIGLAAMMVANEELQLQQQQQQQQQPAGGGDEQLQRPIVPKIDLLGYVGSRFDARGKDDHEELRSRMNEVCDMLRALREGKYGCGNHGIDMVKLKAVHKKLKKCRGGGDKSKKKKKKRKAAAVADGGNDAASEAKKAITG